MESRHKLKMLQNTQIITNSTNINPNSLVTTPCNQSEKVNYKKVQKMGERAKESIGVIEVCIHQARDIHNICIYQNQDVYAKIYLIDDPKTAVSTKIINGGGKNPIFNETLKLNVKKIVDSMLKCEIWMLSRIKNYLEDQLLGFALVPLCEIVTEKLEGEFPLSSNDISHAPAGSIQLDLKYSGTLPEVVEIPMSVGEDLGQETRPVPCDLAMIEFPDPNLANENDRMVSEYIEISKNANFDRLEKSNEDSKVGTVINVTVPESKLVQKEIVGMYMKSMQQFTESLAKMKLPLDMKNDDVVDSGEKIKDANRTGQSPRVFYGSRAFF